jgi:hypothetical protein
VRRRRSEIVPECVKLVRDKIGPVAAFKLAVVVDRLPKTRSGKILRGTMVKIADGEDYKMPATIDDPAILDEIGRRTSPSASREPPWTASRPTLSATRWTMRAGRMCG